MALLYLFANVTTAPTSQLDANFQTVGLLGVLPCSVSGTNVLTLNLLNSTNAPTVSAYQNYLQFSFVAGNTNTGAVTAQIGALAALNVYKVTIQGPQALVAGDIIALNSYELTYNSALNGGIGGFIINARGANFLSSNVDTGSAVSLTTNTAANITSLANVPPGDWDVWMESYYKGGATTTVNYMNTSIGTTTATANTATGFFSADVKSGATIFNYSSDQSLICGPCRFNLAAATTIYGVAKAVFGVSTCSVYGLLRARRVG